MCFMENRQKAVNGKSCTGLSGCGACASLCLFGPLPWSYRESNYGRAAKMVHILLTFLILFDRYAAAQGTFNTPIPISTTATDALFPIPSSSANGTAGTGVGTISGTSVVILTKISLLTGVTSLTATSTDVPSSSSDNASSFSLSDNISEVGGNTDPDDPKNNYKETDEPDNERTPSSGSPSSTAQSSSSSSFSCSGAVVTDSITKISCPTASAAESQCITTVETSTRSGCSITGTAAATVAASSVATCPLITYPAEGLGIGYSESGVSYGTYTPPSFNTDITFSSMGPSTGDESTSTPTSSSDGGSTSTTASNTTIDGSLKTFCDSAVAQSKPDSNSHSISRTYNPDSPNALTFSITFPAGADTALDAAENLNALAQNCPRNTSAGALGWLHGGTNLLPNGRTYALHPSTERYAAGICTFVLSTSRVDSTAWTASVEISDARNDTLTEAGEPADTAVRELVFVRGCLVSWWLRRGWMRGLSWGRRGGRVMLRGMGGRGCRGCEY
ncbi:hypothetical protein EJ04DRAFT_601095 [Polyplosphaeria fusca]|uniref:Uncharacterized protein n=1 Tax=Polyplosphaeria fusca TaxID=682080 RepID=A0A9P4R208_9PLEO|nr:hypothetical protein EJ04DRAFT_601095 [Polyplosphaeria fusca]